MYHKCTENTQTKNYKIKIIKIEKVKIVSDTQLAVERVRKKLRILKIVARHNRHKYQ